MIYSIIAAIALVFIIEGILPFASPTVWRKMVRSMAGQPDRMIRITGLFLMIIGVIVLIIAHRFI